jgi:hypothetical protein
MKSSANYVLLEAKQHSSYFYPDIHVSLDRLVLTQQEVHKLATTSTTKKPEFRTALADRAISLSNRCRELEGGRQTALAAIERETKYALLENTGTDLNGRPFIGNIDYDFAMCLVRALPRHSFPLNLRLFVDYVKTIRGGARGKKVFDAAGNCIPRQRLHAAWKDLTHHGLTEKSQRRAEWVNGVYEERDSKMCVRYLLPKPNGDLVNIIEPLEACLMIDRMIDFNDWINNATPQGLPQRKVCGRETSFYRYPRHQSVAGLVADTGGANLFCDGDPQRSRAAVGVRVAKIKVE